MPNDSPSHDTFGRVFATLDPPAFERCLLAWVQALAGTTGGFLVAIDGAFREDDRRARTGLAAAHFAVLCYLDRNLCAGRRQVGSTSRGNAAERGVETSLLAVLAAW